MLGRRGPAQAAFTNPEVRELGEMMNADIDIDAGEMELDEISREWLESDDADPTNRRNVEIFTDFSGREPEGKTQEDRAPLPALARRDPGRRQGRADRDRQERAASATTPAASAPSTRASARRSSAAWCCARSATRASRSRAFPSTSGPGPIRNDRRAVTDDGEGSQVPGLYAVGWIKRGPSGVIGTNKKDAQETVDKLFEDLEAGKVPEAELASDRGSIEALLERAQARPRHLRGLAGDRRRRGRGREAARPPAREVLPRRGAYGGVQNHGRVLRFASGRGRVGMALVDDVKTLIEGALPGSTVEVIDEGGGDHLRVNVTASQFEGLNRIDQHRLVKSAVRERSDTGELHSLSIRTSVPE